MSAGAEPEVDVDEYRFADRYVAARCWALASALADHRPGMRVSQVVDEERTPLLVVHDATGHERVQLDLVGWVLYGAGSGRIRHLYWDEVFAAPFEEVVQHVVSGTGPVEDDGSAPRRAAYRWIARTLARGLADDPGWLVQSVRIAGAWSPETLTVLAGFPEGHRVAREALAAVEADDAGAGRFEEPLWVVRHGMEPVVLVDASTGRLHARDGSWRDAADDERRAALDGALGDAAELTNASAFREVLHQQWSCLERVEPVDPAVDVAPIRYGHVRAEAWRVVAAVLAAGADVTVVGPRQLGELCRLVDREGRTRVCVTSDGMFVDDPDVLVIDWWDAFAAPLPSCVPERVAATLPTRVPDGHAVDVYRMLAQVLATAVDDDAEWRVLHVAPGRWAVVRTLEIVVVLDERDGEVMVGPRWARRLPVLGRGRGAA